MRFSFIGGEIENIKQTFVHSVNKPTIFFQPEKNFYISIIYTFINMNIYIIIFLYINIYSIKFTRWLLR